MPIKDNQGKVNFHVQDIVSILKPFTWIIALLSVLNQVKAKSHVTCYELENNESICKLMFMEATHEAIYLVKSDLEEYLKNYEKIIENKCDTFSFYNISIFDKKNKFWIPVHDSDWLYKSKYSNTSESIIDCLENAKAYEDSQIAQRDKDETNIRLIELGALFIGLPALLGLAGLTTFLSAKLYNKCRPETESHNDNQVFDERSKLLADDDESNCFSAGMHGLFNLVKKCNPKLDIGPLSISPI